jgi:hypothetical protein
VPPNFITLHSSATALPSNDDSFDGSFISSPREFVMIEFVPIGIGFWSK